MATPGGPAPPPDPELAARLAAAVAAHQAGRLAAALAAYTALLADPAAAAWAGRADALRGAGLARAQLGAPAAGVDLLRQALALNPAMAEAWVNLGDLLLRLDRAEEAVAAFREAIDRGHGGPALLARLADLLCRIGQPGAAVPLYRRALGGTPEDAALWRQLGLALLAYGRHDGAMAALLRGRKLQPDLPGVSAGLGGALAGRGDWLLARAALHAALAERPSDTGSGVLLARVLLALGQVEAAAAAIRRVLALRPGLPAALPVLARALLRQGRAAAALSVLRRVPPRSAASGEAALVAGHALLAQARPAEAVERYAAAPPSSAEARHGAALARLTQGDCAGGWPDYALRLHADRDAPTETRLRQPRWTGEADLAGRTIFLYAERAVEDTLHFIRYVPMVAALGARVLLRVQPALHPLIAAMPALAGHPDIALLPPGAPLPGFDLRSALADLPGAFATTLPTVPAPRSYLAAPPALAARWRTALPPAAAPRIGVAWNNRQPLSETGLPATALPPALLGTLLDGLATARPAVLHALGPPDAEPPAPVADALDRFPDLIDLRAAAADAANLAAALACMDLVIAVDGPVLHLAAALGRPVWAMLPYAADWRWLIARRDSPWYPTARLFRQPGPGDWPSVLAAVAAALKAL